MSKSARQSAFEILYKVERSGAYSNLALDAQLSSKDGADGDSALLTALVYGVLERLITLDYNISLYLRQPLKKLKPEVLIALRIGAYQLLFMDRIPESAAVNESVKLAKNNRAQFAAGLVNAVLRKVASNGLQLPDESDRLNFMSVKYSVPEQTVKLFVDAYSDRTACEIFEAMSERAKIFVRVNTQKCTADELIDILARQGVEGKKIDGFPDALELVNGGAVEHLDAYKKGLFHVQDLSSQLCCMALDPQPGDTVYDMCAAPGGKSFTLAELTNCKGKILAMDVYPSRLALIENGSERLGLDNIAVIPNDAAKVNPALKKADRVLCDAPCSGLGILRRKPEIRYKTLEDIDKLPVLQYDILCSSSEYVKVGGRLVYSTCSLNPAENSEICNKFLSEHKNFEAVKLFPDIKRVDGNENYLTLMPQIHGTDGFFIAAFTKTE